MQSICLIDLSICGSSTASEISFMEMHLSLLKARSFDLFIRLAMARTKMVIRRNLTNVKPFHHTVMMAIMTWGHDDLGTCVHVDILTWLT